VGRERLVVGDLGRALRIDVEVGVAEIEMAPVRSDQLADVAVGRLEVEAEAEPRRDLGDELDGERLQASPSRIGRVA